VRRLDALLDRIPLVPGLTQDDEEPALADATAFSATTAFASPRLGELLRVVKALSATASSNSLLPAWRLKLLLEQSELAAVNFQAADEPKNYYETEIEWLLISKATVQTYGVILNTLLDQIIPLSDDIWYWDEVLGSYTYSSLYTVQTSPLRLWSLSKDVYRESTLRLRNIQRASAEDVVGSTRTSLTQRWQLFYGIVRDSIRERSIANIQRKILSPIALCRSEARRKQVRLKKLREMTACGLGVLMGEGLDFRVEGDQKTAVSDDSQAWKGVVERSVALMDMVLKDVLLLEHGVEEFEDKVFAGVEEDPELSIHVDDTDSLLKPSILARRLLGMLESGLPNHISTTQQLVRENGRPSPLVRYWLPLGLGLLSSTTILRIIVQRQADIIAWIADLGVTVRDFWVNWVVDPSRKIIRTIRHDANSELALMSRDSLKADRESLERMVVDFALEKPHFVGNTSSLSESQIAEIRAKVTEGDVTPILRAYEKDLRRPFVGAVTGDLVRSLLIQVQKTKVDLEVAISGIDALLKSQELVFGFIGLTPGILVSIGIFQYFRGIFGGRKGAKNSRKAGKCVRVLRNIDRIFSEAAPSQNNILSYKDHGLLLCEVHILRNLVRRILPRDIEREFLEDLDDLANIKGIQVQVRALERIRWAYSKWLR
jgi:nuclear control of ATPase protein 2